MLEVQKLELRAGEIRARLAELGGEGELTDEQTAEIDELRAEYISTEKRIGALTIAGDVPGRVVETTEKDAEGRELDEIRERTDFADYLTASLERRAVMDGAALELNQALGVPLDRFPLEVLAPSVEERAAIDGDAERSQSSWIDRLFADTAAMALGISMPSVAPGVAAYPLLNSNANPVQRGRTEAVTAATITASVTEIKPSRNAVHAVYSVEDDARLPGLAEAIRRDLSMAMTEKIDRTIFLGDAGANENAADITGLQTAGITEIEVAQENKVKGDKVLEALAGLIDGKYAVSMSDLRIVATVGTNQLWLSTVQNSAASNETVAAFLRANGINWRTRGEIEDATAAGDFAAFIGLARGQMNTAVAPVWNSAQIITDPYSEAKSGQVLLTLSYLWGFSIPRTDNYRRIKYVA